MTARVLVDAARIAYGEEPEMEHNEGFGDADIIMLAEAEGQFKEVSEQRPEPGKEPAKIL
ncbi:unnamed protein product [Clonostachys rosea f. rosea IK726]|uniref:Uncharacterized protein n=1 Tax=Clonostachys rosea f. rosea IK726 TaxID=1349383 RepID=A0ACA9TBJ4_BIOOC|nr:unnamed protein product [Clonostachys rosea f. rosea IK726]